MTARKSGRPGKADAEARSARIAFRVTEGERAQIEAAAAATGATVSDYARALVTTANPPRQRRGKLAAAALSEMNRVGVNLNQIAFVLNRGGAVPLDLAETIAEVRAAVEKLAGAVE